MTIYAGYGRFGLALDPARKRALAAQWLVEKRLARIRRRMEPEAFVLWTRWLEMLLEEFEVR